MQGAQRKTKKQKIIKKHKKSYETLDKREEVCYNRNELEKSNRRGKLEKQKNGGFEKKCKKN